jgi:Tfp pilus assembly protein PilX
MQRIAWSVRADRIGLAVSLAVLLVLAGLIGAQAARIVATERRYAADRARVEECSDLGDLSDYDCQD